MWSKERDLVFQAPGFSHSANSWSAAAPPASTWAPDQGHLWGGLWVREEGLGYHRPALLAHTPHPPLTPQDHHLGPPCPLPGRAGPAPLGNLHHLERGPTGPPALPQPDGRLTAQGGGLPLHHPPPQPHPCLSGSTAPAAPEAVCCVFPRWLPSATWTRTRSERVSTATRALRCRPPYTPARESLTPHLAHCWVPSQDF